MLVHLVHFCRTFLSFYCRGDNYSKHLPADHAKCPSYPMTRKESDYSVDYGPLPHYGNRSKRKHQSLACRRMVGLPKVSGALLAQSSLPAPAGLYGGRRIEDVGHLVGAVIVAGASLGTIGVIGVCKMSRVIVGCLNGIGTSTSLRVVSPGPDEIGTGGAFSPECLIVPPPCTPPHALSNHRHQHCSQDLEPAQVGVAGRPIHFGGPCSSSGRSEGAPSTGPKMTSCIMLQPM